MLAMKPPQAIAKENANLFLRLIIRMASHRAWSLSTWSEIAPEQWNGVLSSSHDDSRHAFAKMRQDADSVEKALAAQRDPNHTEAKAGFISWHIPSQKKEILVFIFSQKRPSRLPVLQGLATALHHLWIHKLTLVQESWLKKEGSVSSQEDVL